MTLEEATVAIAVGTFLAVIVALFRDDITAIWRKPKIEASIKLAAPDCHLTRLIGYDATGTVRAKTPCYYLRLWIENTGRIRAEEVQVFFSKLERKQANDQFREDRDFLPMNLKWSHAGPGKPLIFVSLNPKMGRHCDFGHIVDPANDADFLPSKEVFANKPDKGQTIISLDLEIEPATYSHLIPPGTYRVTLMIGGANFKPVTRQLEVVHTGEWYPDEEHMFRDGLGITLSD